MKLLDNISDYVWCHIVEPRLIWDEDARDYLEPLSFKIPYYLLQYPIDKLNHLDWLVRKRLICLIKGCDIKHYSHFNMPEGCNTSSECARCGAFEEFGMTSAHEIIEK